VILGLLQDAIADLHTLAAGRPLRTEDGTIKLGQPTAMMFAKLIAASTNNVGTLSDLIYMPLAVWLGTARTGLTSLCCTLLSCGYRDSARS